MATLRLAADFLRPAPADREAKLPVDASGAGALEQAGLLLVLNIPVTIQLDFAMQYSEELDRHLDILQGSGVRILWLEAFGIRASPVLSARFRDVTWIEVLHQPHFGLHMRDADLLSVMPSLSRLLCSKAKTCLWLDLDNAPVASLLMAPQEVRADAPEESGCWFRLPSGCPASPDHDRAAGVWQRDTWGERGVNAGGDPDACLRRRRDRFNEWCGVDNTEMHYIPRSTAAAGNAPASRSHAPLDEVFQHAGRAAAAATQQGLLRAPSGVLTFEAGCYEISGGCAGQVPALFGESAAAAAVPHPAKTHGLFGWAEYVRHQAVGQSVSKVERAVVWSCHPSFPCGGHGDRVKGIIAAFVLALVTDRRFFVDAPDPWDLRLFLEPALLDWRVVGLSGLAAGRHVLWDHDLFERSYLDRLLASDEPVWVVYTNKHSLVGPLLRHHQLAGRAERLGLFRLPHMAHHIWRTLFRPTAAMQRHLDRLQFELGGPGVPFIAMHHRAGDATSGFGIVNGEVDRRGSVAEVVSLLGCAHVLERRFGLPNTTRWYLAVDSAEAIQVPQVEVWRQAGKLVTRGSGPRTHLAVAGVVPPTGSRPDPAKPEATPRSAQGSASSAVKAAEVLAGVADAWADFLLISQAAAAVVSSSAFGIMAAQIGGLDSAFYVNGCVRLDLVA